MTLKPSQLKVLSVIYMATDCSNKVYDYATLHHTQRRIAEAMPEWVTWIDGCTPVDEDGFSPDTYTEGRGYRLTQLGYEALTASSPDRFPPNLRRFGVDGVREFAIRAMKGTP